MWETCQYQAAGAEGRRAAGTEGPLGSPDFPAAGPLPTPLPLLGSLWRGTQTRRLDLLRDLERPTRYQAHLAEESAPQVGPRASRRAKEGSGFGFGQKNTVRKGRRRTWRQQRYPSRRGRSALIRWRPLHHTEISRGSCVTFHQKQTVKAPHCAPRKRWADRQVTGAGTNPVQNGCRTSADGGQQETGWGTRTPPQHHQLCASERP